MTTLIAGGGIAGAAAACLLGSEAMLFEREQGCHDKVCGEFISWEACDNLVRLGLDLPSLRGVPINAVRLVHGRRSVVATLPRPGLGLSRRQLDVALLDLAAARGARIHQGAAVRRLASAGLEVDGIGFVPGHRVFLATGKHDLRGVPRPPPGRPLVGFKTHLRLAPGEREALDGHVEVILFPGGYAGLQPVEGGRANLCLLIRQDLLGELGGRWAAVLGHLRRHSPHLDGRLFGAQHLLDRPLSVARIPYGFVHGTGTTDFVYRLGDQMAVIPSFSGDGMAIALHTAFAAVRPGPIPFHAAMRRTLRGQISRAMILHRLGQTHPAWLVRAASLWPGALAAVARLTRVAAEA